MPTDTATLIAVIALALAAVSLLLWLWLAFRFRRLGRTRRGMAAAGDLQGQLDLHDARLNMLTQDLGGVRGRLPGIDEVGRRSVQQVGVVRFNPFDDTGGQQSFALALLDGAANGVVISSLHSRQQTRIYLKSISGGKSEANLSAEETEALRRATETRTN
jgi:HAMP domain-containing protein